MKTPHVALKKHARSGGVLNGARPRWLTRPLCPISIYGSPVTLLKFQMAPRLILLMSSGSKKEPRYAYE